MKTILIAQMDDEDEIEVDNSHLPSIQIVYSLLPQLSLAAQKVYDNWDENPDEFGGGGICHLIADEMYSVLSMAGIDAGTVSASVGEQHVWCVVKVQEGVYEVDIHPSYYETGGGYTWQKIPDVQFDPEMIKVGRLDSNPSNFENFLEN